PPWHESARNAAPARETNCRVCFHQRYRPRAGPAGSGRSRRRGPSPARRATHTEDTVKGLQGKVALVTGGSSGIGQAIAIRLGEEGANVAINYVGRPEGAISTKEAIEQGIEICVKKVAEAGGRPILVAADVSDEHAVEQMFDQVLSEYGGLDILINNA